MSANFDVLVVGSGPAGVSACFPLLEAGLSVAMVHGGKTGRLSPPDNDFLSYRATSSTQWERFIGRDFYALQNREATSPKLRVPIHAFAFDGFLSKNKIVSDNFVVLGSLASGGLSNAWGCGVASYNEADLNGFPFGYSDIKESYDYVSRRIGISGEAGDDLSDYLGLDGYLQPALPMDMLHKKLYDAYKRKKTRLKRLGFILGRSRVAALSREMGDRQPCEESGNCLWGCKRRSLYSANEDLAKLRQYDNFFEISDFVVDKLDRTVAGWTVQGASGQSSFHAIAAQRIILAAGTLATTRLVFSTVGINEPTPLYSCPTAAFMIWLPRFIGASRQSSFALAQQSYKLTLREGVTGFGSTFSVTGILMSEFLRAIPFSRRYGIDLLRSLLSSCVVGNVFLPGSMTKASVRLRADSSLIVTGEYSDTAIDVFEQAKKILRAAYFRLGGMMLPGSFTIGLPGSDIHYAGTLPMKKAPELGQTSEFGEVHGMKGVYVVDGASLSALSEKSHTLTIMANADRIARWISKNFDKQR